MPNPSYTIEQSIVIPVCILFSAISTYQIYLAYNFRKPLSKRYIHILCALQALFLMIEEIDPFGVFGRLPLWFSRLMFDLANVCGSSTLAVIIYSHFQTHYFTLKKQVPPYLAIVLAGDVALFCASNIIASPLVYVKRWAKIMLLYDAGTVQFMWILFIADAMGCRVVYRLMIDMIRVENGPRKGPSENTFKILLARMKKFHSIMLTVLFGAGSYVTYLLIRDAAAAEPIIFVPSSPDEYLLDGRQPALLLILPLYTWWAWIPREGGEDARKSSGKSSGEEKTTRLSRASRTPRGGDGVHSLTGSNMSPISEQELFPRGYAARTHTENSETTTSNPSSTSSSGPSPTFDLSGPALPANLQHPEADSSSSSSHDLLSNSLTSSRVTKRPDALAKGGYMPLTYEEGRGGDGRSGDGDVEVGPSSPFPDPMPSPSKEEQFIHPSSGPGDRLEEENTNSRQIFNPYVSNPSDTVE